MMVRTSLPWIAVSLLSAAVVPCSAVAQSRQRDRAPKAPSGNGPENEFKFEVLSIHPIQRGPGVSLGIPKPTPNGFSAKALIQQMVLFAYGPPCPISVPGCGFTEIRTQPGWFAEPYAFDARVSQSELKAWQNQSSSHDLLRSALRTALKERFNLVLHKEPKQQPMIELVIAKGGPRLKGADPSATLPVGARTESGGVMTFINGRGGVNFHGATIGDLVNFLTPFSREGPVRDRTGLTGRYDFSLRVDPESNTTANPQALYSLHLEQLGLKLKAGTENRPILVIDHVERPTAN